jgi:hypothetical protein
MENIKRNQEDKMEEIKAEVIKTGLSGFRYRSIQLSQNR